MQAQLTQQPAAGDLKDGWKPEEVEQCRFALELPSAVATPEDGVAEIRVVQIPDAGRLAMRADRWRFRQFRVTKLAELFPGVDFRHFSLRSAACCSDYRSLGGQPPTQEKVPATQLTTLGPQHPKQGRFESIPNTNGPEVH